MKFKETNYHPIFAVLARQNLFWSKNAENKLFDRFFGHTNLGVLRQKPRQKIRVNNDLRRPYFGTNITKKKFQDTE